MKRSADSAFVVEQLPGTPESCPSPTPSTSDCPARKRSRSEVTPEERKEARAHRNRIAAQNSRDRRKAQFSYLEQRVAELEEENRQLRAGRGITALPPQDEKKAEERERDIAREKENQELRERIKTLENGWDAVVKALAASGLPLNVPTPSIPITAPSCTLPIASPTTYPLSPAPSTPSSTSSHGFEFEEFDSTRHLARVATADAPLLSSVSLQRVVSQRINSNSSSTLPPLLRLPHHLSLRRRQSLPSTRTPCRISSARSSRHHRFSRRRLYRLVPPAKSPPRTNHSG